jgi:hypothetical protein
MLFDKLKIQLSISMILRLLEDRIREAAHQMPVVSVTGPRQSGKTTICQKIFPDYLYTNLENPKTRAFALEQPEQFLGQGGRGMIIDEAQYAPELFSWIQVRVDETRRNGEYILSGSQNFLMLEKITQSLAGRVAVLRLLPLGLEEIRYTEYFPKTALEFVFTGGFPRIYDQSVPLDLFFSSYLQTYLERDVRQVVNVGDLDQFQQFVRLCAGRVGQLFNQSELGNALGVSHPTIKKWFSILQSSFIAFSLPPHFRNFNKRIIKTPKLYFYDTGLACFLLGIRSPEELEVHFARGALFENFVISEFIKNFTTKTFYQPFYFWRDRTGHEIDLLLDLGSRLIPVEIKSSQTIKTGFFKNLDFFNQLSGNDPALSMIIHAGDTDQKWSKGHILPWNKIPTEF